MEVDGVFASDDVSDGAALGLAGGLLGGGHFCELLVVMSHKTRDCAGQFCDCWECNQVAGDVRTDGGLRVSLKD